VSPTNLSILSLF